MNRPTARAQVVRAALLAGGVCGLVAVTISGSGAEASSKGGPKPPSSTTTTAATAPATSTTSSSFAFGQLNAGSGAGCGSNTDGEPAIRVARDGTLVLGSERGLGGGSDAWRQAPAVSGSSASACGLTYVGQPNAVAGVGASGGDIDVAMGSATESLAGSVQYPVYVSSLNLGSVSVATSLDGGRTFSNVPVQGGLPGDDREWMAAYGANTSLLTFHDVTTDNIDVLRSDNMGATYTEISRAIPDTDYKASNNEIGNIAIDHRNLPSPGSFYAYQSFVAPSKDPGLLGSSNYNEAFVAVSSDGGSTWTDKPVPCSVTGNGLNHQFPNVAVAPNGQLWLAWSDDTNVFTATSSNQGSTWTCSGSVSSGLGQSIEPWLSAGSAGVDLVFYGTPTAAGSKTTQIWSAEFEQNTNITGTATGWSSPLAVTTVHSGSVCEGGASCTTGRQLFDDFGVDIDPQGYAHIAYSHDAPDLGGSGTYTGYAVQTAGTTIGTIN